MPTTLKILRVLFIILCIPGILITLFAAANVVSLLWDEFFPDPNDIAHGMAMLGFVPMVVWTFFGVIYLVFLRFLWLLVRKALQSEKQISKIS